MYTVRNAYQAYCDIVGDEAIGFNQFAALVANKNKGKIEMAKSFIEENDISSTIDDRDVMAIEKLKELFESDANGKTSAAEAWKLAREVDELRGVSQTAFGRMMSGVFGKARQMRIDGKSARGYRIRLK